MLQSARTAPPHRVPPTVALAGATVWNRREAYWFLLAVIVPAACWSSHPALVPYIFAVVLTGAVAGRIGAIRRWWSMLRWGTIADIETVDTALRGDRNLRVARHRMERPTTLVHRYCHRIRGAVPGRAGARSPVRSRSAVHHRRGARALETADIGHGDQRLSLRSTTGRQGAVGGVVPDGLLAARAGDHRTVRLCGRRLDRLARVSLSRIRTAVSQSADHGNDGNCLSTSHASQKLRGQPKREARSVKSAVATVE